MIQEKGIDPIAVDKIGKYVELKGTINVYYFYLLCLNVIQKFFWSKKKMPYYPVKWSEKSFNGNMGFLC